MMKKFLKVTPVSPLTLLTLLTLVSGVFFANEASAQQPDTVMVQTFTYSDITKRRGVWNFPDSTNEWRKILMYYNLKCDPATTQDQFDCGEWDYLTYNRLYDHRGLLDSTYKTGSSFKVGNSSPDSLPYSINPTYTKTQEYQYSITHDSTIAFDSAIVGNGTSILNFPFSLQRPSGRSQFIFLAPALSVDGLNPGDITGIRLGIASAAGNVNHFRIKIGHTAQDSMMTLVPDDSLTTVFHQNINIGATGWMDFQFTTPFTWDGTSNIVIDFSYEGGGSISSMVYGMQPGYPAGLWAWGDEYCLDFPGGGKFLNLGSGPQISGANPRTIEAWAYTRNFNNGGIFQAGTTGSVGKDFSLRTKSALNEWRVQQWGAPDFDVTTPNSDSSWHHFAVTYDGGTTTMYYDGQQVGSKGASLNTGAQDLWIGRWSGSYFQGMIDAVRIWDTALTQQTIQEYMGKETDVQHPNIQNLKGDYRFNEGQGMWANDTSSWNQQPGFLSGLPWWHRVTGEEMFRNFVSTIYRPNVVFEQGTYVSTLDSTLTIDSTMDAPVTVTLFENPSNGTKINDNDPNHPSLPTDTLLVWNANMYAYTFDKKTGAATDSNYVNADSTLYQQTKEWYSPEVVYEIGRFITPYGINLDLGPNGFTWIYDVTDYAPLLRDSVDLQAGNQQELIDLKFMFIRGTAPRDVKTINRVWGDQRFYSYKNMDDDVNMSEAAIVVHDSATTFKVKTRMTGHGHNSNDGSYPHCCEWKDNEHEMYIDGQLAYSWHIWQDPECAMNAVWPQGGTWPGIREGWCPGDVVKDYEFDITNMVVGDTVKIDYDITDVPANNQGMGNGNYVVTWHLMQYGDPNFSIDGEIYDVIAPTDWEYYSRDNPTCLEPKIILRNSGQTQIDSVKFVYGVDGGTQETYTFHHTLGFLDTIHVNLPIPGKSFWNGSGIRKFNVSITEVNGAADAHPDNDTYTTDYIQPDTMPAQFVVVHQSNNFPWENSFSIKDHKGNVIFLKDQFQPQYWYYDTLILAPGHYTFEVWDTAMDGMYYWAYPAQGTGWVRFASMQGFYIHTFLSEFGYKNKYAFVVVDSFVPRNDELERFIEVYPNPNAGKFTLEIAGMAGEHEIKVINSVGQTVYLRKVIGDAVIRREIDISANPAGVYFVYVKGKEGTAIRKVVIATGM